MDLPGGCVEEFEGKINKSKLKLVLTNGKIQGYGSVFINIGILSPLQCYSIVFFYFITLLICYPFRKKGARSGNTNGAGRTAQFQPLTSSSALSSDFDSEDELQIDESPPPRRRPVVPTKKKLAGKIVFSFLCDHALFVSLIQRYKSVPLFLGLPRKLPRAKPCSDPHRIREPGEVDFDIEVKNFFFFSSQML